MIIYQAEKSEFVDHVQHHDIEEIVLDSFWQRTGRRVGREEVRSWASSLGYMAKVLDHASVPDDCGVAIEYNIPQTSKRIDFLLTGMMADQKPCVVIVELKQWDSVRKTPLDGIVATRYMRGEAEVSHPSYQAWSYAALLTGFNEAVYDGGIELQPCAYLHNYPLPGGDLVDAFYKSHLDRAPVFLKGEPERKRLREFIKEHVRYGDKGETLYKIEGGRIRPSKSLADALAGMLKGSDEFVLIDDQKLVYESAMRRARKAVEQEKKLVLIVEGGPGTGKSVVAVNLLVGLTSAGMTAKYVTKNAAPRAVYEARLTGHFRRTEISHMFTGSGAFTEAESNSFDALIIDEAHRLNEKSGLYGNLGEHQVKELIGTARFCVFFIDESQKVTLRDVGTKEVIRSWAKHFGAGVHEMRLASQFRCNGSDGYLAWLDHNLEISETANEFLDPSEFDFRVVESPTMLRDLIVEKNRERNRARMVAGYCWKWPSKRDPSAFDVVIPDYAFKARWNLTQDGGRWLISPNSVSEIGCIHTCQGLEVDYIGVIIGDDLIVRNGKVVTQPSKRATSDQSLRGLRQLAKRDPMGAARQADEIIKNTYRTLMTRGMKGCYIYCTDTETAEYFRSRLHPSLTPQMKSAAGSLDAVPIASNVIPFRIVRKPELQPFRNAVPVIPLKIAAGAFAKGETSDLTDGDWGAPDALPVGPGMFIAQVVGESMNKRIPNGSWCLFRANPTGTRHGKVVLAQHRDISDPETGGSFTVKVYSSEKRSDPDNDWVNERVVLSPASTDPRFAPIILDGKSDVQIVAELIAVLV